MFFDFREVLRAWCEVKISLWDRQQRVVFHQGEVWWCSIGMNVGEEAFGKGDKFRRPILIFKKFTNDSFLGLPITSFGEEGGWYVPVMIADRPNWVMLNQARILDKKRLGSKVAIVSYVDFLKVKRGFHDLYCS